VAGMKLGAIIRQREFLSTVARSVKEGNFWNLAPGQCASSCVFAFAGGVERTISEGSQIGVHQVSIDFKSLYKTGIVTVEDLSASFASSQVAIGLAISHFLEMGIDPSIVTMMTTKGPKEIKWLSKPEQESTKIIYDPAAFSNWAVEPYQADLVAFTKSANGTRQLTLFCSARKMKFMLTARDGAYAQEFVASIGDAKEIQVAGMKISKPNFKMSDANGGAVVSGEWTGNDVEPKYRSIFSVFGEVVGSLADLYSIYNFNERGFQQSLSLARKNCVSWCPPLCESPFGS
jgi:hypothetical protein